MAEQEKAFAKATKDAGATPHSQNATTKPLNFADVCRPCPEHNFLTDVADVRQMEKGLLMLLEDFHKGKLQVFGKGCTFEQMDQVREQQEKLARSHFDLDAQQQIQNIEEEDWNDNAFRNMQKLVDNLNDLGNAVHGLKSGTISSKSRAALSPKHKQKP